MRVTVVGMGADGWDGLSPRARQAVEDAEVLRRQRPPAGAAAGAGARGAGAVAHRRCCRQLARLLGAARRAPRGRAGQRRPDAVRRRGRRWCGCSGADAVRVLPRAVVGVAGLRPAGLGGGGRRGGEPGRPPGRAGASRTATPGPAAAGARLRRPAPRAAGGRAAGRRAGCGASRLTVLAQLGGPDERSRHGHRGGLAARRRRPAGRHRGRGAPPIRARRRCRRPRAARRRVRARRPADQARGPRGRAGRGSAPLPGQLLWDVGAGAGSRSASSGCARTRPAGRWRSRRDAERRGADRAQRRRAGGARACGWCRAGARGAGRAAGAGRGVRRRRGDRAGRAGRVLGGAAPRRAAGRERGHGAEPRRCWPAGTRGCGGSLTRISVARAAPVGSFTGWRPAMPVTQWSYEAAVTVHFIGAGPGAADLHHAARGRG